MKINLSFHPHQQKFQFCDFYNFTISIDEYHSFRNIGGTADEMVFKIMHDIKETVPNLPYLRDPNGGIKGKIKTAVNKLIHPLQSKIPE